MHAMTGWFIRNPVAANLLMFMILVAGAFSLYSIRIEGFPKVPPDTVIIQTSFKGAHTSQIDEQITQPLEWALEGLDGVKSIWSSSSAGFSVITVQKTAGQSLQKLLDDVRVRIDGIEDFPRQALRPVITLNEFTLPALYVQVHGQTDPETLQRIARRFQEELMARPEISKLRVWGQRKPEIRIEVEPYLLERHDLTIEQIVGIIQQSSLRFQAGTLKTEGGNIVLRADDLALFGGDYRDISLLELRDGSKVRLGDIATIADSYGDEEIVARFDGNPTVGMEVLIAQRENLLQISKAVREAITDFEPQLPPEIKIASWGDSADYISERLSLLRTNAFQGLLLVTVILAIFLNARLAFWVAMGIPISAAGAIFVSGTKWVDYSLNDVTTFGLIIALGILVDDAVVVGESVFEERAKEKDPILGTEKGVNKISVATVFGVMTTIAAFFPMLLIENAIGKIFASFSGIIILALLFSLLESKLILPAHLAQLSLDKPPSRNMVARFWGKIQSVARNGLAWFRDRIYAPVLDIAITHRYAALIVFLTMGILGLGVVAAGKIQTVFFPEVPGQIVTITLKMDPRAPSSLTRNNVAQIERVGAELNDTYQAELGMDRPPIQHFFVIVSSPTDAQIYAELVRTEDRPALGITRVIRDWRDAVGTLEGITELSFSGTEEVGGGFNIRLFSKDEGLLTAASDEIKAYMRSIDGVANIQDGLNSGTPQLRFRLKPEARHLGFTSETLASQIGYRFGGAEVQKLQRDNQEVRVIVQSAKDARSTIDDLFQTRLRSKTGAWVPLLSVAEVESSYVAASVRRRDGKRVNVVSASLDRSLVSPTELSQGLFQNLVPELRKRYPSVTIKVGGELAETEEIQGGLARALIITALLIYVLMAVPLKSYWKPFVIMSVVPFGFIGATVGHAIAGVPLSLLSFFGMLALTGIVVNDSLVLITRYNQNLDDGMSPTEAAKNCGTARFQAVFLTTVTTVAGLMPLLSETSEQAQYLIPAAVSLAYGEIFATAITLVLIPVLLVIAADIQRAWQGLGFSKEIEA